MTRLIGVHGGSVFNADQLHTTALYDISVVICCLLIYYSISREIYRLSGSSARTDPCHRLKGRREVWIMHRFMLMSHYCSWREWMWKIDRNQIMIIYIKVNLQIEALVVAVVCVVAIWYTFDGNLVDHFERSSGQWRLHKTIFTLKTDIFETGSQHFTSWWPNTVRLLGHMQAQWWPSLVAVYRRPATEGS